MFRQDRTNPSTAVSTWKARKDLPRANPSTAVSNWLNGGLGDSFTAITATGGTIADFTYSGVLYRGHTFNASGTFEITANPDAHTFDVLQYAGGGGRASSHNRNGGGGGGGEKDTEDVAGTVESFTVTIGAGGQVGGITSFKGASWTDTFFCTGGQNIGGASTYHGGGDSGISIVQSSTPSPTYGRDAGPGGYAGGTQVGNNAGAGGGGAGSAGTSVTSTNGGNGGYGTTHAEYGVGGKGGGGGGGQGCVAQSWGYGYGQDGGGNGGLSAWAPGGGGPGSAGTANTGGGAGGNGCNQPGSTMYGGSGFLIVRYALEAV